MNYAKIYDKLVEKCKPRGLDKSSVDYYTEIHHIVPRCMGGSNEDNNLVMFTAREHFVAHLLLWKSSPDNVSLMWSAYRTSNSHKDKINSRMHAVLREQQAKAMSERFISEETKEKISKTLTGHKRSRESIEKGRLKATGQKRSEETVRKLTEFRRNLIASGWTHSEESRKKISESSKGRVMSEEARLKISEFNKGKIIPEEHKQALFSYQKSLNPWQKSAAIARPARFKVWFDAHESYNLWLENDKPKSFSFSRIKSKSDGVEYKVYHFDKLVEMFIDGWIPMEDKDWKEFKDSKEKTLLEI